MTSINTTIFPHRVDSQTSDCNQTNTCQETWSVLGPYCCNWWAPILLTFTFMTLFGNIIVIMAIVRERTLQTQTNYFIVSLAIADLLVAVFVMPFGVLYLFNGSWSLPSFICDCYIAMDVACSTSSILNLVSITIDRFIAVIHPVTYAKNKKKGRAIGMIAAVWVISILLCCPIVLGVNNTPDRLRNECLFHHKGYMIISAIISFYIPLVVMLVLYYIILQAIHKRARKQRIAKNNVFRALNARSAPAITEPALKSTMQSEKPTASGSIDDEYNSSSGRTEAGFGAEESTAPTRAYRFTLAAVVEETGMIVTNLTTPMPVPAPVAVTDLHTCPDSGYSQSNLDGETKEHVSPPISTYPTLNEVSVEDETQTEIKVTIEKPSTTAAVSRPKKTSPRKTSKKIAKVAEPAPLKVASPPKFRRQCSRKEKKATHTLAIVLGSFLVCWLPFFSCSIYEAVCGRFTSEPCAPSVTVFYVTTWLGYINSLLNPIIYTIFNMEFRKAFRKILTI